MKRKSLEGDVCPVARSLDVIGDWWSLLIIRDAISGLKRFGEFQKSLGLAKNILAIRLKGMVEHGIMDSVPVSEGSAYQEYVLTPKGRALLPVIIAMGQWGSAHLFDSDLPTVAAVDAKNRRPLGPVMLCSETGQPLGIDDVLLLRNTSGNID